MLYIIGGIVGIISCFVGLVAFIKVCFVPTDWDPSVLWGSYDLGNGIYMVDWEGGREIIKGTNIQGRTCYGGSYLIPTYESRYDSAGNFAEYVIDAKYDNNWIIAKTGNYSNGENKYYIVDKSFDIEKTSEEDIVENYIFDFTDSLSFANVCHQKGIKLKW
jgi:hypothetical protein